MRTFGSQTRLLPYLPQDGLDRVLVVDVAAWGQPSLPLGECSRTLSSSTPGGGEVSDPLINGEPILLTAHGKPLPLSLVVSLRTT